MNKYFLVIIAVVAVAVLVGLSGFLNVSLETKALQWENPTSDPHPTSPLVENTMDEYWGTGTYDYFVNIGLINEGQSPPPTEYWKPVNVIDHPSAGSYPAFAGSFTWDSTDWIPLIYEATNWDLSSNYKGYMFGGTINSISSKISLEETEYKPNSPHQGYQIKGKPGTLHDFTVGYSAPASGVDELYQFEFLYRSVWNITTSGCHLKIYNSAPYFRTDWNGYNSAPYINSHPDIVNFTTKLEYYVSTTCGTPVSGTYWAKYLNSLGTTLYSGNSLLFYKRVDAAGVYNPRYLIGSTANGHTPGVLYAVYTEQTGEGPTCNSANSPQYYNGYKYECGGEGIIRTKCELLTDMANVNTLPGAVPFSVGGYVKGLSSNEVTVYIYDSNNQIISQKTETTSSTNQYVDNIPSVYYQGTAKVVVHSTSANGYSSQDKSYPNIHFNLPELTITLDPPGTTKSYGQDFNVIVSAQGITGLSATATLTDEHGTVLTYGPFTGDTSVTIPINDPTCLDDTILKVVASKDTYTSEKSMNMVFNPPQLTPTAPSSVKAHVPFQIVVTSTASGNICVTATLYDGTNHVMPTVCTPSGGGYSVTLTITPNWACSYSNAYVSYTATFNGVPVTMSSSYLSINSPTFSTDALPPFIYNKNIHITCSIETQYYTNPSGYPVSVIAKEGSTTVGTANGNTKDGIDIVVSTTGTVTFTSTAVIEGCSVTHSFTKAVDEPPLTVTCDVQQHKLESFQVEVLIGEIGDYNNHDVSLALYTLSGTLLASTTGDSHPSAIQFPAVNFMGSAKLTTTVTLASDVILSKDTSLNFDEESLSISVTDEDGNTLDPTELERLCSFYVKAILSDKPSAKFSVKIYNEKNGLGTLLKTIPSSGTTSSPILIEYPDYTGDKSLKVTAYIGSEIYTTGILNIYFNSNSPLSVACWQCSFSQLKYKTNFNIQVTLEGGPSGTPEIDIYLYRKAGDVLAGQWLDKSPGIIPIVEPLCWDYGYLKLNLTYTGMTGYFETIIDNLYFSKPTLSITWPTNLESGLDFVVEANAENVNGLPMKVEVLQGGTVKQTWTNGATPSITCSKPLISGSATMKVTVKWDNLVDLIGLMDVYFFGEPVICTPWCENTVQYSGLPVIFGVYLKDINGNPLSPSALDGGVYTFNSWFSSGTGKVTNTFTEFLGVSSEGAQYRVTLGTSGIGTLNSNMVFSYSGEQYDMPAVSGVGISIEQNTIAIDTSNLPSNVVIGESKSLEIHFKNSIGEYIDPDTFTLEIDLPGRDKAYYYTKGDFDKDSKGIYTREFTFDQLELYTFNFYATASGLSSGEAHWNVRVGGEGGMAGPEWISLIVNFWWIIAIAVIIFIIVIWRRL